VFGFNDLNTGLHLGLVLRLSRSGRQDDGMEMVGKLGGGAIQFGFVAVGQADQGARVIRNNECGHAADKAQCPVK
jgi:hypothetical protein